MPLKKIDARGRVIEINGMKFIPREDTLYCFDYVRIAEKIEAGEVDAQTYYRNLCQQDLWFLLYFALKVDTANHPFVTQACYEVQTGPRSHTLDLWARGHYKSTSINFAENVQDIFNNPNERIAIISYSKSAAVAHLVPIKLLFEKSEFLKYLFPDILFANPEKDSPKWSEQEGITIIRNGFAKERTVEAYGLIEGMPTGRHYTKIVYDDIVTVDHINTPEIMDKVKRAYDLSRNLGLADGTERIRIIGTHYHHDDPLIYIKGKRDAVTGAPIFTTRIKPGTDNGEANGNPVLLTKAKLAELRTDRRSFNSQILLNPSPLDEASLNPDYLVEVNPKDIPKRLYKFMVIDFAGTHVRKDRRGDCWAILVVGIEPYRDDLGASDVYVLDAVVEEFAHADAMNAIVDMYMRNGRILSVGVEKVGASSAEIHIANALRARKKFLSIKNKGITILSPAGRKKEYRIESALSWPLMNSKVHVSKGVLTKYRDKLKTEMEKFPFYHDDILDALSYFYDMIKDYRFGKRPEEGLVDPYAWTPEDALKTVDGWMVV